MDKISELDAGEIRAFLRHSSDRSARRPTESRGQKQFTLFSVNDKDLSVEDCNQI